MLIASARNSRSGFRQRHDRARLRHQREQFLEPAPALPRHQERLPAGNREIDRRQRAAHHDRTRDHDASARFLPDDQIGADCQHARLQDHPQRSGNAAEAAGDIAGAPVCARDTSVFAFCQRSATRSPSPMARTASALRRPASISALRSMPCCIAARVGPRDRTSVRP